MCAIISNLGDGQSSLKFLLTLLQYSTVHNIEKDLGCKRKITMIEGGDRLYILGGGVGMCMQVLKKWSIVRAKTNHKNVANNI